MEEFKELDDLFKKGLENARVTPPAGVWEGIASSVSTATTVAGQTSVWLVAAKWFAGALVAAGVTYMAVVSLSDKEPTRENTSNTAIENSTASTSDQGNTKFSKEAEATSNSQKGNTTDKTGNASARMELPPVISGQTQPDEQILPLFGTDRSPMLATDGSKEPVQNKSGQTATKASNATSAETLKDCRHTVSIGYQRVSGSSFAFQAQNAGGLATWYFGDGAMESGEVTSHVYDNTPAVYFVKVVTQSPFGCRDSALEKIVVSGGKLNVMNVFTPNGDGINDEYYVNASNTVYYDMVIRDMQGREVFRSDNPEKRWNGKCKYIDCPEGKYQLTLAYKYPGDENPVVVREIVILTRDKVDRN